MQKIVDRLRKLSPSVPSSFFNTREHTDERMTVSTFVSIENGQHTVNGDAQPERGTNVSSAPYFYKSKLQVETHWGILNMD
jgi:hypothetical protein